MAVLLGVEVALFALLRLPSDLGFSAFAFGDRGGWMTVVALVGEGRRPTIDFGYPYGLLPIWLSRGWFDLFGLTPGAFQAGCVVLELSMAWAIARIVAMLRLPFVATVMVIVALPFAIPSAYPSIAHALEAALICNALAEQAAGRRHSALALAAAACFAKPSMGYVYGLLLLIWIGLELRRTNWRELWRKLLPAIATVATLSLILGSGFGLTPLVNTLLPLAGIHNYAAFNFGFFHGIGSYFWYGAPPLYYLASVVGFWFVASAILVICAGTSLVRGLLNHQNDAQHEVVDRRREVVISAAILHVVFVTTFFAGPASWSYYSYILVIGAAVCWPDPILPIGGCWLLVLLAACGQTGTHARDFKVWKTDTHTAATAGLWASAEQQSQWEAARRHADSPRAMLLSPQGYIPWLFPGFIRPPYAYLTPGVASPVDVTRALQQFDQAPVVIAVTDPNYGYALTLLPPIATEMRARQPIFKNAFFAVYRRSPH